MKKTIIALMAMVGMAQAATVISFGGQNGTYTSLTDAYTISTVSNVNTITSYSATLSDKNSFTLTNTDQSGNTSNFWGGSADGAISGTWSNTAALTELNTVMGTSFTAADFSSGSGLYYTAPGNGGSYSTLTFNFTEALAGDTITMYVMATAHAGKLETFSVTGLSNYTVAYATTSGDGFSSTAASSNQKEITMFRVTGTLADTTVAITPHKQNKSGFHSVAYQIVPEPTTATLSLLALAGLAARRRRR